MQMNNGATPAYLASQERKLDILKYIVTEAKGSLKITAFDGMSCLHASAQMGHLDIIKWLVSNILHIFCVEQSKHLYLIALIEI